MDLETVLDRLHRHGQRATYAAVGGVAGRPALSVMRGRPKDRKHSWVVARANGLPTGYTTAEVDPRMIGSPPPIDDVEQLRLWLRSHP
jgi:hypothetical protein